MFARALIVLLIAINIGVALWWALRPEPAALPAVDPPAGVSRLQLISEAKPLAAVPPPPMPAAPAPLQVEAPAVVSSQCHSLGPFADKAALDQARKRLQPQVLRMQTRNAAQAPAPRGYNILLPPLATRELAQAAADKIKAAGFDDLLLINTGDDANGIALGRYGSLESAQRRQASLQAAGFATQLRPIGGSDLPAWLDIETQAGLDIAKLRSEAGAAQSTTRDCASVAR